MPRLLWEFACSPLRAPGPAPPAQRRRATGAPPLPGAIPASSKPHAASIHHPGVIGAVLQLAASSYWGYSASVPAVACLLGCARARVPPLPRLFPLVRPGGSLWLWLRPGGLLVSRLGCGLLGWVSGLGGERWVGVGALCLCVFARGVGGGSPPPSPPFGQEGVRGARCPPPAQARPAGFNARRDLWVWVQWQRKPVSLARERKHP